MATRSSRTSGFIATDVQADATSTPLNAADRAALLGEIGPHLRSDACGLMLYGSRARGTARADSDIDILQLVPYKPKPVTFGRVNVTSYQITHLRDMAVRGSLFVLHLKNEGIVLEDTLGHVQSILNSYQPPEDYAALQVEIAAATAALAVTDEEFVKYGDSLARLGVYLTRTLAYINSIENGFPTFDPDRLHIALGDPELRIALELRNKKKDFTRSEVEFLYTYLASHVTIEERLKRLPLEALGVELSGTHPHAASLIANTLSGDNIDYAAIALPPL